MPYVPMPSILGRHAWLGAIALAAGLGVGSTAIAAPDPRTVEALRVACEGELAAAADAEVRRASDGGGWCAGYLSGVADTLAALGAGGHPDGICGARHDARTLVETFVLWARVSPRQEYRGRPMLAGAQAALRARWPCA